MKTYIFSHILCCSILSATGQTNKIELFDLVKSFVTDSTGYSNVGNWAVGSPKKYAVKWKADRIIMSEDTSINFYRLGTADITINGKIFMQNNQPVIWNVMLKGPRMGYTSFSIISTPSDILKTRYTIDSLFGKKPFKAQLIKSCDGKDMAGYYYYQLKLPRKDVVYIRLGWLSFNGKTALRIDCYDDWSKYAAKLGCP